MVQKVILSAKARKTFNDAIDYLTQKFSEKEILKFTDKIDETLSIIITDPRLARKVDGRPNVYKIVINKRIVLYYQYKPLKKEILLLTFWNTLQNPKRLKF